MKKLKLYYIDNNYIDYLRQYDNKVAYNKMSSRPYIGIVYTYENHTYFAPLSSPKEKHKKISEKAIDVFKIDGGRLGIVNINNMIPAPIECLTEALSIANDHKYRLLLGQQQEFLNLHRESLTKAVMRFQRRYKNNFLSEKIVERTCNFPLLEEKCNLYEKQFISNENEEEKVLGKQR